MEELFIQHVADARQVSTETVIKDFGQGGLMLAPAALKVGLIDQITTLSDLIGESQGSTSMTKQADAPEAPVAEVVSAETKPDKPAVDDDSVRANERTRAKSILTADAAADLPGLASHLAFDTELSSEQALSALSAAASDAENLKVQLAPAPEASGPTYDDALDAQTSEGVSTATAGHDPKAGGDDDFADFQRDMGIST